MTVPGGYDGDELPRFSPGPKRLRSDMRLIASYVALAVTLVSLIFSAGYNWRRIDEITSTQVALNDDLKANYARKDVNQQQFLGLAMQLDEIKSQLAMMQRAAERHSSKDKE